MNERGRKILVTMWAAVAVVALGIAPGAQAVNWPIQVFDSSPKHLLSDHEGYYDASHRDSSGHAILRGGISANNLTQFYNQIDDALTANTATDAGKEKKSGAAFIILTMLGYDAHEYDRNDPQRNGNAIYNDWKEMVKEYYDDGRIDFNYHRIYRCGELNSYMQDNTNDPAFFDANNSDPNNIECTDRNHSVSPAIIRFSIPGGNAYEIKKNCANPIGKLDPLTDLKYSVVPRMSSNAPGGKVRRGQEYQLNISLTNSSQVNSDTGRLGLMYPGNTVMVQPPASPSLDQMDNLLPGGGGTYPRAFRSTVVGELLTACSPRGMTNARNWYWGTSGVAARTVARTHIKFTVPANAPVGPFTVTAYYAPATQAGLCRPVSYTFDVQAERSPYFLGYGSDIHVGGCSGDAGNISANTGSFGEYVVSALGAIGGIGSKSSPTGGKALNLGSNGTYAQICKPNIAETAIAKRVGSYRTLTGNALNLNNINAETYETYYHMNGQELTITGTTNRKVTIVQTSGPITIIGDVRVATGNYARANLPTLGIISAGDIRINGAVNTVEAYMFADGTINTCTEGVASAACAKGLEINGFLMAGNVALNRTGAAGADGAVLAETVRMTPQLYLNPPRFFDDIIDDVLLEGQGELRPLY